MARRQVCHVLDRTDLVHRGRCRQRDTMELHYSGTLAALCIRTLTNADSRQAELPVAAWI